MIDDDLEETADRVDGPQLDDRTVVVERGGDDRTVVVARRGRPAEVDDGDRTVVVARRGGTETEAEADRTVVVERKGTDDRTVAVPRQRRGRAAAPVAADPVINLLPRRRGIRTAPIEPGSGREPVEAIGPNVVETYVPREIAPPPAAVAAVPRGEEALRAEAPSMPSVLRQSRRAAAVSLLVFGAACAVSVVGVVAVVVWFVRG